MKEYNIYKKRPRLIEPPKLMFGILFLVISLWGYVTYQRYKQYVPTNIGTMYVGYSTTIYLILGVYLLFTSFKIKEVKVGKIK